LIRPLRALCYAIAWVATHPRLPAWPWLTRVAMWAMREYDGLRAPLRVYIAAPKLEVRRAKAMAELLMASGIRVVSTWHDFVCEGDQDPSEYPAARRVLCANMRALRNADVVLALTCEQGGRGVYTEIGRALERGTSVVWSVEKDGRAIDWADCRVASVPTDEAAIDCLLFVARRFSP